VVLVREGVTEVGTFTPMGCQTLAMRLACTPVALHRSLEHVPFEIYEALGGPPAESVVGEILEAHYVAGVGVVGTQGLRKKKQRLHDLLLVFYAADAVPLGPSLVFHHSGAPAGPECIVSDAARIFAVDVVWCPGAFGRFLAPVE